MTPGELEGRGPDPSRSKAIVAMLLAGVFFAVMGISTRATSSIDVVITKIPAIEVTFFRFLIGVLVLLPLQGKNGIQLLGNNRKRLVYRGIIGGFAVLCYFLSLQQTSLIHAQLLNYGSIVFAPIFASIFLKEKLGIRTVTAVLTAATGMFLILHATNTQGQTIIGDLYGLLSGILAGAAITEIRLLRQSESSWSIFFYLSLIGLPLTVLPMFWIHPVIPTVQGWICIGIMGLSSCLAQILMTFGYKYLRTAEGALLTMTQIVYVSLASVLVFHEHVTVFTGLGAVLVLGSALWLSLIK